MNKENKQISLSDKDHLYGRMFLGAAIILILAIPVIMCLTLKVFPEWGILGKGLVGCIMFIVGGFIEVMTYSPMLGTKGTYLAFLPAFAARIASTSMRIISFMLTFSIVSCKIKVYLQQIKIIKNKKEWEAIQLPPILFTIY